MTIKNEAFELSASVQSMLICTNHLLTTIEYQDRCKSSIRSGIVNKMKCCPMAGRQVEFPRTGEGIGMIPSALRVCLC